MAKWNVCDDAVGIRSGRKWLEVCGSNGNGSSFSFPVEFTTYTGSHTAKGRRLANRLCKLLNEIEAHCAESEAK